VALVPGLSTVQVDAGLDRIPNKGRVAVDERGGVEVGPLRPAASPVNTYARPPQPVRDDRLARLADALGSLNQGLQQFGSAYMKNQFAGMDENGQAALVGRTQAEVAQLRATGNLPAQNNPVTRSAVYNAGTVAVYNEDSLALQEKMKNFNFETGDVDKEVTQFIQARWEQLRQSDPKSADNYLKMMNPYRNNLIEYGRKRYDEIWKEKDKGTVTSIAAGVLTMGETNQWAPEKTAEALNTEINEIIKTGKTRTFNAGDINDQTIAYLKTAAKDRSAASSLAILKFLDHDRGQGENGQPLGSIASVGKYADHVREIRSAAMSNVQRHNEVSFRAKTADADARSMVAGELNFNSNLTDTTVDVGFGKTVTVSGSSRKEAAAEAFYSRISPELYKREYDTLRAQGKNHDEATTIADEKRQNFELTTAQRTGVINEKLKTRLNDFSLGLSTTAITDPVQREEQIKTFRQYSSMVEKNPGLANTYVTNGKSEEALRTAWILNKVAGYTEGAALAGGARVMEPLSPNADKEIGLKYQELDVALSDVFSNPQGLGWGGWVMNGFSSGGVSDPENYGQVKAEFEATAKSLVKAGVSPLKAIEATKKYFQDPKASGFTEVNGTLMRAPKHIDPETFKAGSNAFIDNYLKAEGTTLGWQKEQISVRDNRDGSYDLIQKGTGAAIERTQKNAITRYTLADVQNWKQVTQAAKDAELSAEQAKRNKAKADADSAPVIRPDSPLDKGFKWLAPILGFPY
jgi:hypothetical protein